MAVAADKGVVVDDMGGDMQCNNHPYKNNNNPGGICAFCLQEKLGRLVSSSKSDPSFFPVNTPPSTTAAGDSSSSPSSLITARSSNSGFGTSNTINIKNAAASLELGTASSSSSAVHDNNNHNKTTTATTSSKMMIMNGTNNNNVHHNLLETSQKKTRKSPIAATNSSSLSSSLQQHQNNKLVMLKRSKSSAASNTRRIISHEPRNQIFDNDDEDELGTTDEYTTTEKSATRNKHHRGFWSSFLHLSSASNRTSKRTIRSSSHGERDHRDRVVVLSNTTATNADRNTISSTIAEKEEKLGGGNESSNSNGVAAAVSSTRRDAIGVYGDENDSPNSSSHASSSNSFGRKVARSRSVGCGSRSFSGAFLEKISTGFGDCSTLRRVESQRESNYHNNKMVAVDDHHRHNRHIKERVKCGGIFGGFTMTNTSNSISNGGRVVAAVVGPPHGRSKNWGWAFASPMRAFRPPTSSSSSSKPDGSVVVAAAPKDIWFV